MAIRRNEERDIQDETLYCERCGISFLHSAEEQHERLSVPTLCPGCRTLLPRTGRERGIVKWYSRSKKYGFIVRSDEGEIFAHRSQLQGFGPLREGDLVEFAVGESERGPMAVEIRILQRATDVEPDPS